MNFKPPLPEGALCVVVGVRALRFGSLHVYEVHYADGRRVERVAYVREGLLMWDHATSVLVEAPKPPRVMPRRLMRVFPSKRKRV